MKKKAPEKIEAKCFWREKLRLEKVVTNKHLRLVVETEEERRARLENVAATKRLRLAYTDASKQYGVNRNSCLNELRYNNNKSSGFSLGIKYSLSNIKKGRKQ